MFEGANTTFCNDKKNFWFKHTITFAFAFSITFSHVTLSIVFVTKRKKEKKLEFDTLRLAKFYEKRYYKNFYNTMHGHWSIRITRKYFVVAVL